MPECSLYVLSPSGLVNANGLAIVGLQANASTVGALIEAAQTTAENAQTTADAAQTTADLASEVVNTQLSEAEVDAFVANNGFANNQDVAAQAAQLASLVSLVDPSVNDRFQACSDGLTVADRATGLLWERKTGTLGSGTGVNCNAQGACVDPHDINNLYSHGRAFSFFLGSLNGGEGFGGHTDWRLPVVSEWQSILVGPGVNASVNAEPADPQAGSNATGQPAICSVSTCVDPGFSAQAGPTSNLSTTNRTGAWYWSAASRADNSFLKYLISFDFPHFVDSVFVPDVQQNNFVRAVRNGSCSASAPLAEQLAATDVVVSGLETAVGANQSAIDTAQGAADAAQAAATTAAAQAAATAVVVSGLETAVASTQAAVETAQTAASAAVSATTQGVQIRFGRGVSTLDGTQAFSFDAEFPNECLSVTVTPRSTGFDGVLPVIFCDRFGFGINRNNVINNPTSPIVGCEGEQLGQCFFYTAFGR